MFNRTFVIFFLLITFSYHSFAYNDSLSPKQIKNRKLILAGSSGLIAGGSIVYLHSAWFKQYSTGKFHFFNDNKEWLQMDKCGHMFTNYQVGRLMMEGFDWAHFSRKQKLIYGGGMGFAYMTVIELMDGMSSGWGFSWGDIAANGIGTSLAISQEAYWNEQRIQIKFSYAKSGLAKYNPSLLGETFYTQILKDYNGQTYWLSVNPTSFVKKENKFPKWLSIAIGYSGYGMLGGFTNTFVVQDENGNVLDFQRQRRLYLSLDVDLTRIKTRSRFLKGLFSVVNILKFPAPAIQFSNKGTRAYLLYY